ncbi:ABC transporter ATP-binding protein [Haloarcula sp. GH36]|uniref:ABC transporter ATP-binding protein n=1 Tax=Haloarcula montana TaxID=3111776 RepID=UPI002D787E32|nr:ABC transporter ATP-binding protein [Haloarcula sp. GH36]
MVDNISIRKKLKVLWITVSYKPLFTAGIIILSIVAALFEGIGLGFIIPIIDIAQSGSEASGDGTVVNLFSRGYDLLNIPFTLETVIIGVAVVITLRYTMSFLASWLSSALRTHYIGEFRTRAFENALHAEVSYYDTQGTDEILNTIITESSYCGTVIKSLVNFIQQGFLTLVYAGIALYISPVMTIAAAVLLGVMVLVVRSALESGYLVGDRAAEANESVQESIQVGTQGIREVKLFNLQSELLDDLIEAVDRYVAEHIQVRRNKAAISNVYQWGTAVTMFAVIYTSIRFANLSLSSLGVFLFSVFRLASRVSTLNTIVYTLDSNLPHFMRVENFIEEMENQKEEYVGSYELPEVVESLEFEDVSFHYEEKPVLKDISFNVDRDEFVAFVGPSGAGKSTIVSLLARLYTPNSGQIYANDVPIEEFDLYEWRSRIAVVRQNPDLFNDTLRSNITLGNRDATNSEIKHACKVAQVTEFLDDLPEGLGTQLGDEGVRLSGGQRQRVAIARALLKDADYLLLDEATSDLDATLEEKVHAGIESLEYDRGLIVIAHRLSTVVSADRIYTMEDGRIVEVGSHDELLRNEGLYANLYATQP